MKKIIRFDRINFIFSLLLVASIATILGFTIPYVSAVSCVTGATTATIDCPIASGVAGNIVSLRDTTDTTNDTKTTTVDLDKSSYHPGDTATITISDFYANLDSSIQDTITATVNGNPIVAIETGASTSTFVGHYTTIGTGGLSVAYNPIPKFSPRFQLTFDNGGGDGDAILSDHTITADDEVNDNFNTVVVTANFTLANGASLTPGGTEHIVISYANAELDCVIPPGLGCDTDHLSLWVAPPSLSPFNNFLDWASFPGNPFAVPAETIDPVAKTISFDTDLTSLDGSTSGTWLFVLAFETNGAVGGSGGGIVRPGLVLNFLAGVGRAENTVTPPSFGGGSNHYSDGLTFTQGTTMTTLDTSKYNQELPKQVMVAGEPVNMTFKTFENYNPTAVVHMGLYIIPRGQDMITPNSIGSIVWEKGKPVEVNDPNNILSNDTASSTDDGKFQYTKFSFTPEKSYDKMSFLVRAWNDHNYSTDIRVHDDIKASPVLKILPAGVVKYNNFDNLQAALETDKFYRPQVMAHIHSTTDVFSSTDSGHLYWLYDTINHTVTLVMEDKNDNELYSYKASLDPFAQDKIGDYGFMQFTVKQLNRADQKQEEDAMKIEAAKAMTMALENGLMPHYNW